MPAQYGHACAILANDRRAHVLFLRAALAVVAFRLGFLSGGFRAVLPCMRALKGSSVSASNLRCHFQFWGYHAVYSGA